MRKLLSCKLESTQKNKRSRKDRLKAILKKAKPSKSTIGSIFGVLGTVCYVVGLVFIGATIANSALFLGLVIASVSALVFFYLEYYVENRK